MVIHVLRMCYKKYFKLIITKERDLDINYPLPSSYWHSYLVRKIQNI